MLQRLTQGIEHALNCANSTERTDKHESQPNKYGKLTVRSNSRKKGSAKYSTVSHNSSDKRQRSISAELNKSQQSKQERRKNGGSVSHTRGA